MRYLAQTWKRPIAMVLALVMIVSMTNGIWTFRAAATPQAMTEADLVAQYYTGDLTPAEKNVLHSGILKAETFQYDVPADSTLVTVDPVAKTITAQNFVTGAYTWKPTAATVEYSGGSEAVTLVNGTGTFQYGERAYSVKVSYALKLPVSAQQQSALLQAPYNIASGMENIRKVYALEDNLKTLGNNIDTLYDLIINGRTQDGIEVEFGDESDKEAVTALYNEVHSNGGKLKLVTDIEAYRNAASKTKYLLTQGGQMKQDATNVYTNLNTLTTGEVFAQMKVLLKFLKKQEELEMVTFAEKLLKNIAADLAPVVADPWAVLTANPVKSGVTDAQYAQLDILAEALKNNCGDHSDITPTTEVLPAATESLSVQVARKVVTIQVSASVMAANEQDPTVLTALPTHTQTIELDEGMDAEAVLAAIQATGVETAALNAWNLENPDYNIETANYDCARTPITGALTADMTYCVAYTPKTYTITYDFETDLPTGAPYGYGLVLPKMDSQEQVYDYVVNGQNYFQEEVYRIQGQTQISRSVGKPWDANTLGGYVAAAYAGQLTVQQQALLKAAALKGDTIRLRKPGNEDNLVVLDPMGNHSYKVTAQKYNSGYNGIYWLPESVTLTKHDGTAGQTVALTETADGFTATFTTEDFINIKVNYTMDPQVTAAQVQALLDLPAQLAGEAAQQKQDMQFLLGYYGQMDQVERGLLSIARNGVESWSEEALSAIDKLIAEGMNDETGKLYLQEYLTDYNNNGKLAYYYRNGYGKFAYQMQILKQYLPVIVNDQGFEDLKTSLSSYREKLEKIPALMEALNSATLHAPNYDRIDVNSQYLDDLVTAIDNCAGHLNTVTATTGLTLNTALTVAAPNQVAVTVRVFKQNGSGQTVGNAEDTVTFDIDRVLTAEDVLELNRILAELEDSLGIDRTHYVKTGTLGLTVGTQLSQGSTAEITWAPDTYTVVFRDGTDTVGQVQFPYDSPVITLPACTEQGMEYAYTVSGTRITVGSTAKEYRFDAAQIDALFTDNTYTVTRQTENVALRNLKKLVTDLNKALLDGGLLDNQNRLLASFILAERPDGTYAIVLRIAPNRTAADMNAVFTNVATAIIKSPFDRIAMGGQDLWESSTLHLQAAIDALLNSEASLSKIYSIIDGNGDIREMQIPGAVLTATDSHVYMPELLGGELVHSTLGFGNTDTDFYITVEDYDLSASRLLSLRNMLGKLLGKGDVSAADGAVNISFHDLPEKLTTLYIAAMLVTGHGDVADLSDMDRKACIEYVASLIKPLLTSQTDRVSLDALENTAGKLGKENVLGQYKSLLSGLFDTFCQVLEDSTFTNKKMENGVYSVTMTYDISTLLEKMNIGTLVSQIAEKDTGIQAKFTYTSDFDAADYQAVVVDLKAGGLNKLSITKDITAKTMNKGAVIVLLGDVTGNLSIPDGGILDLNGKTVNGNLNCAGTATIVDSTLATAGAGTVTGAVNGNAVITAGHYTTDVSAKLASGHSLRDGAVCSDYYTIRKQGNDLCVVLTADMESVKNADRAAAVAMIKSLAFDLALSYYTSAALTLDGSEIYSMEMADALSLLEDRSALNAQKVNEILDCIHCDGITTVANTLLQKLTDLDALAEAVGSGTPLLQMPLTTKGWTVELKLAGTQGKEYVDADILPGQTLKNQNIKFYVESDDNVAMQALLEALAKITEITADVQLADIQYANSTVTAIGSGAADVTLTLKNNPDYAVMLAVILADRSGSAQAKTALVEAIRTYYETGNMGALKTAVEAVTTANVLTALKNMSTGRGFSAMLSGLGLTEVVPVSVERLEATYHTVLCAVGAALRRTNITGGGRALSTFAVAGEYGTYSGQKALTDRNVTRNVAGGYSAGVTATSASLKLTVKLFAESIILVTDREGNLIYQGDDLKYAFAIADDGATVTVQDALTATEDASLSKDITLVGADNITFDTYTIQLLNGGKLTSDKEVPVVSGEEDYVVAQETEDGKYIYTLEAIVYTVEAFDAEDNRIYKGESLKDAIQTEGAVKVQVNEDITMTETIVLDKAVEIVNVAKVTFAGLELAQGGELTTDAAVTVTTTVEDYEVKETAQDGKFNYTLEAIVYTVEAFDAEGNRIYKGESLKDAIQTEGAVKVQVNEDITMTETIVLDKAVEIVNVAKVTFAGLELAQGGELTTDAAVTVTTTVEDYEVKETAQDGKFNYTLEAIVYAVEAFDAVGNRIYKGESLKDAIQTEVAVKVQVNEDITMTETIVLDKAVEIVNVSKVTFAGLELAQGGELTTDAAVTVTTADEDYEVKETEDAGKYTYTMELISLPQITGAPVVNTQTVIRGSKVDEENKLIFLDVDPNGITQDQFEALVVFPRVHADQVAITVEGTKDYMGRELIVNGATVTAVASNSKTTKTDTVQYTVIIMGDTNCNGRNESGDTVMIARHYVGQIQMTGVALLAADMNQNERIESGDKVMIAIKYTHWSQNTYVSGLQKN